MLIVPWKEDSGQSNSEMWLSLFQRRTDSLVGRQLNWPAKDNLYVPQSAKAETFSY
jgi:hypothetical protein